MDSIMKEKKTTKAKKIAEPVKAATSVVSAFGGSAAPAIFMEEVAKSVVPPAPAKKAKKPAVVAVVTPDGIQGNLSIYDNRPLIAHLPNIHSEDIDSDLFSNNTLPTQQTGAAPCAYDPNDIFMNYETPVVAPVVQAAASKKEEVSRPTLPLHYSEKLMIRFLDANRDQTLPDSTEVACFWDCHPFRGRPCVIPVGIEEGIWRVYGNFCCPECAAAYLFNEHLDSHVQWERFALLNRLYSVYVGEDKEKTLHLAPSKSILRLFGGTLDISEYREIIYGKRMRVDVMSPPMISIIQVMDTKPIDFYDASMKNTFIPWEMDRMNRPGAQGLRLRRSKPVMDKEATLEFCMGIKA
jgi:hypothetical protein